MKNSKLNTPKILIAEDEEDLLELYKLRFECESFKVVVAQDGEEVIEKTKIEKPDLLLLDIMMPKKTGLEALKEIRKDPSISNTPVIALTALSSDKMEKQALKLGVLSYLIKAQTPVSEVVEVTKEAIKSRK